MTHPTQLPAASVTAEVIESSDRFEVIVTVKHGVGGIGDSVRVLMWPKVSAPRREEEPRREDPSAGHPSGN